MSDGKLYAMHSAMKMLQEIESLRTQLAEAQAKLQEAERDAARYRWFRQWFIRGALRAEIDPHGHVRQTTNEIIDAAIDAAMEKAK